MVYFPVPDSTEFHSITGSSQYEWLLNRIDLFKTYSWTVILNVPVTPLNVQWLPYIYEYAHQQQLRIFFHYDLSIFNDPDVKGHIKRFSMVRNHLVLKRRRPFDDSDICQAVPRDALCHSGDKLGLMMQQLRKRVFFFR